MLVLLAATQVQAKKVILYENDFEAPKATLTPDPSLQLIAAPNNDVK